MTPRYYIEKFDELLLDMQRNDIIESPNEFVGLEDIRRGVEVLRMAFVYNKRMSED